MRKIIPLITIILVLFFTMGTLSAADADTISQTENDVKGVLKKVSPSIVKVVSENHKRYIATGIAIAPNHIISSLMVIRHPYEEIYIKTVKGDEYPAKVLGKDRHSSLILLEIDKKALTPIRLARGIEVGDWAALVGVFYRRFPSIYQGLVSSVSDEELILNAPVAPGSSGGAVVNKKGELMGAIRGRFGFTYSPDYIYKDHSAELFFRSPRSRNKDLCYAVPVSRVMTIADDLEKYGEIKRGWLGLSLTTRTEENIPEVSRVSKNSPAEKAGIRKGDKILKIDGKSVKNHTDVIKVVKTLKPGQRTKIELLRDNVKKSVIVVVANAKGWQYNWDIYSSPGKKMVVIPEISGRLPKVENYVFQFYGSRTLGVDVMSITPELAEKFNVKEKSGLMISKVYKDTAADKAGFQAADIIVRAGEIKTKQITDLRRALNGMKNDESIAIEIYRNGTLKKIKVVPDRSGETFFGVFDRVKDKLKDIRIKIDDENRLRFEEAERLRKERSKMYELRERYAREAQLIKERELKKYKEELEKIKKTRERQVNEATVRKEKELKNYKEEIERMKKVQEELRKEVEKMRKLIEMEKKKQKTEA
jgi:serine protease Do